MRKGNKTIVISATGSLSALWRKGFFKEWKKYAQIVTHLSKDGYHFTVPELGMALKRAAYLTRRGKRGTYEYIQKGPYAAHEK